MRLLSEVLFAVWALALGRTIANLFALHRLGEGTSGTGPLVSIIIPARNESRSIERSLRAFLAQDYPNYEVILVDDRSTDGTGEIARSLGDARLIVVEGEEPPPGWLGKPWALHQGSLRARGELLLFVDADVHYQPATLSAAVAHMQRDVGRRPALIALLPHMEMHGFWEHIAMPGLAMFAFSLLPAWLSNRTRIAILAIGAGTGNLVRRADYEKAGGHVSLRDAVVDDVGLARLVRRNGGATEAVRAERLVSVRMYHGGAEILRGFTKNAFPVMNRSYLSGLLFLLGGAIFHLLPYVLAFTGDAFALGTVGIITLTRVILFSALGYRLDNAIFGHPLMIGFWGAIMIRSMWKTGVRRELEWRGRTYDAKETRFGADR
jgi:chlorobactene glucosyltransferase